MQFFRQLPNLAKPEPSCSHKDTKPQRKARKHLCGFVPLCELCLSFVQRFHALGTKINPWVRNLINLILVTLMVALLGGCGFLFGTEMADPAATPAPLHKPVPTFTPTPVGQTQPTVPAKPASVASQTIQTQTVAPPSVAKSPSASTNISSTQTSSAQAPLTQTIGLTPTAATKIGPRLTIDGDAVNVRRGPATTFELIGSAAKGQSFTIVAKNAQGDWWQVCCINEQKGWIFGQLARVENADSVAVAVDIPTPPQPSATPVQVAVAPTATVAAPPANLPVAAPPASTDESAGNFDPNAAYQIVDFKVLGFNENNGGIRDSRAQHLIFVTVLDANGNGVDGAVVQNLVGDHSQVVTGGKGPGKTEITMYYDPFKLTVATDPSGPTTSQVSNQMGLAFPHLPDIVGKLGGTDYEYAVCPTLEINCQWPIHAVHYSYQITFKKVK